jgi:hypothetical protein
MPQSDVDAVGNADKRISRRLLESLELWSLLLSLDTCKDQDYSAAPPSRTINPHGARER